jgi:hypothetical protein
MARIDKYQPVAGGFRAPLNAAYTGAVAAIGVGLNSSGRVVAGAGVTGIIGVVVSPYDKAARDIIDVMTAGEMVEFGGVAGTTYTANTTTCCVSNPGPGRMHRRGRSPRGSYRRRCWDSGDCSRW